MSENCLFLQFCMEIIHGGGAKSDLVRKKEISGVVKSFPHLWSREMGYDEDEDEFLDEVIPRMRFLLKGEGLLACMFTLFSYTTSTK